MLLPVQCGAGFGQLIIAIARAGNAKRHIRRVGGDLVGDATLLHVILLGQSQMFLGGDIAKHARPVIRRRGRADARGDVVITREKYP